MADEPEGGPRVDPFQAVVAVVVVAAVIVGYLVATQPSRPVPPDAARPGDIVTVDYIGFFPDGRVFDTSLEAVATNNATYPKAPSFELRDQYSGLQFTLGGGVRDAPRTVVEGFERGILEPEPMRVGETREIVVPPEMGYGHTDPDLVEERPLTVEIPQQVTVSRDDFLNEFGQNPEPDLVFPHPFWTWPVTVLDASEDFVTYMHTVEVGFTLRPHDAWTAQVVRVDTAANQGDGVVVVHHLLEAEDVNTFQAQNDRGTFRVVAVDPEAGTYTVDYNREVVGNTLVFRVTLLKIDRF